MVDTRRFVVVWWWSSWDDVVDTRRSVVWWWWCSWDDVVDTRRSAVSAAVSVLRGIPDEQRLLMKIQRNYDLQPVRHTERQRLSTAQAAASCQHLAQLRQSCASGLQLDTPRGSQVRAHARSDRRHGQ